LESHYRFFLRQTAPFDSTPIISELAAFERTLMTAFDAADAHRLCANDLAQLNQASWPALALKLHPSVQLFRADWNSVETWQALKAKRDPGQPVTQKVVWLVWRNPERLTEFRSLDDCELELMQALISGATFADVCEKLCKKLLVTASAQEAPHKALGYLSSWL